MRSLEVYVNEQEQVIAVVAEQVPEEGELLAVADSQENSFTVALQTEVQRNNLDGNEVIQ